MTIINSKNKAVSGFSLIEALLSLAVFMLMAAALVGALSYGVQSPQVAGANSRALLLAEEGLEAARNLRDTSYAGLTAGTYGLAPAGGIWTLSGTSDTNGIFERHLDIADVDATHKIVTSTVSYKTSASGTSTVTLATFLTNWRRAVASHGNWASSSLEASFDLTSVNSGNTTANGISIAYSGDYVYLGRNLSGGSEFYVFDVSSTSNPTLVGQAAMSGSPNSLTIVGNYVYSATTDNKGELAIINISNPAAPTVSVFDLANANSGNNNNDGLAIATDGSYLYLTRINGGREFYIFDLVDPANPALIGQLDLSGNPNAIVVSGDFAYIASSDNASELQVVNISTKTAPFLAGAFNLNSGNDGADGLAISYGNGYVYLGRANSAAPEYYVIDVSTPTAPVLSGTLEIGANVSFVYFDLASNYSFLVTAGTTNNFAAIDNANAALPAILDQLSLMVTPNELVYNPALDRVFIASSADTQELQIIKPQ